MEYPQSLESPKRNCFCGYLASPCRDYKYCSERCALEDTGKMLIGEPSHYRNISQAEILEKLVQSDSPCRVAQNIMVEASIACNDEYEPPAKLKPLPPLPPPQQSSMSMSLKNSLDSEDILLPRQKRLHASVLARRAGQK